MSVEVVKCLSALLLKFITTHQQTFLMLSYITLTNHELVSISVFFSHCTKKVCSKDTLVSRERVGGTRKEEIRANCLKVWNNFD